MSSQKSILIVEDDDDIRELIKIQLELDGHHVYVVDNATEALSVAIDKFPDLFIIDRMLPDMDGAQLCQRLRSIHQFKNHPILFLTAMAENEDEISGLDAGADDYITKPFDLNILKARVRAFLRRYEALNASHPSSPFKYKGLEVDFSKKKVTIDEELINLTRSEYLILEMLCYIPGRAKTRETLMDAVTGDGVHVTKRVVDTHVAGLRKKIKQYGPLIETVRGVGYRLNEEYEK